MFLKQCFVVRSNSNKFVWDTKERMGVNDRSEQWSEHVLQLRRHRIILCIGIAIVLALILLSIVQTNVSFGNKYDFLLQHSKSYVSITILYFGFGTVLTPSSGCSGFYWDFDIYLLFAIAHKRRGKH